MISYEDFIVEKSHRIIKRQFHHKGDDIKENPKGKTDFLWHPFPHSQGNDTLTTMKLILSK